MHPETQKITQKHALTLTEKSNRNLTVLMNWQQILCQYRASSYTNKNGLKVSTPCLNKKCAAYIRSQV